MVYYMERATQLKEEIICNRRHFHQNAEVGMNLPKTVDYVCRQLESYGYKPQLMAGGVTCTVGKPGKTILLRADMDALPQAEASGVEYACTSGDACHSCGHDTHTAMLLAAAKMLKERETELPGTVKFMFQPGEETIRGAKAMIDAGILENPKPDAAFAIHAQFGSSLYTNAETNEPLARRSRIMTYVLGPATQSADQFTVTVHGKSCHGVEPFKGVSAISAACNMVSALQQMISMEVNCQEAAVMTICQIEGGTAPNILCDKVTFKGTLRTFDNDLRARLRGRFTAICQGVADAFGAKVEVEYPMSLPSAYNHPAFTKEIISYVDDICDASYPVVISLGSEDFSWISANVDQALLMNLCCGCEEEGYTYPGHNPRMTLNEDVLPYGAACYAHCAEQWLRNHEND